VGHLSLTRTGRPRSARLIVRAARSTHGPLRVRRTRSDGALAGGADEVIVNESHEGMRNLVAEDLHEGVRLITGASSAAAARAVLAPAAHAAVRLAHGADESPWCSGRTVWSGSSGPTAMGTDAELDGATAVIRTYASAAETHRGCPGQ